MSDPRDNEAKRVQRYSKRHAGRTKPCPPPATVVTPPREIPGAEIAKRVARRAKATPKNVYRIIRRNTPEQLKTNPVLQPARLALGLYRRYLKPPDPAVTGLEPEPWIDGLPTDGDDARRGSFERHQRPRATTTKTPRIAALVLNRDGAHHLRNLFDSILAYETYPALSIWVVDHHSTDDSHAVLDAYADRLDLHTVRLEENRSFSASNNDLARRADADLLLLLNNDIIFDRPILRDLAAELDDAHVGAVGCRLHYPSDHADFPGGAQHVGIKFYEDPEAIFHRPYNLSVRHGIVTHHDAPEQVPAATAAFLLCRKRDYLAVGGLDEAYVYGYEDVDFCLRLKRDAGLDTIVAHHLSAIHDESATQSRDPTEAVKKRRRKNRAVFEARWGLFLRRAIVADRLNDRRFFVDTPLTVGFAVTEAGPDAKAGDLFTATELAASLESVVGCRTKMLPATDDWYDLRGVDVLVAMVDRYDPRQAHSRYPGTVLVAWARNWFDRWAERDGFWDFDLCFVSAKRAAEVMHARHGRRADVLRIATHPERFTTGTYDATLAADVCFTGSHWGAHREIEDHLAPGDINGTVAIWGSGWDEHPTLAAAARGFLPYERLPDVYASTKVVIDDANHVTKPWGSTNSRVFDALAAGALVVTNGTLGAEETFGDRLPTYDSRASLTAAVNEALANDAERERRTSKLRTFVLEHHTYDHRAHRFASLVRDLSMQRLRIAIKIAAPKHESKHHWGDYHFALALRRAFARLGHLVRIDLLHEWDEPAALADDVVLVLRGLNRYPTNRRQVNLMWNISHPDAVSQDEYESFDHVFVASHEAAASRQDYAVPVSALLQCTDPELFHPGVDVDAPAEPVLFVGSSRNIRRPIVMDAIEAGLPLAIYGGGWSHLVDSSYVRDSHIANTALSAYYERAGVVLNDHWDDMRAKGFLSNRLFDAAASGAIVVSDPAVGLERVFQDAIETYTTVDELSALVTRLQQDPTEARARARALSEHVREAHSFAARAVTIIEVAQRLLARRADES